MTIIYEKHPVAPERKAELRAQGYRILDAVFAPKGYVHPDAEPAVDGGIDPSTGDSADINGDGKLSVAELRAALTAKGVDIPAGAKKAELQALLDGVAE